MKKFSVIAVALFAALSFIAYGCGERGPREEGREAGEETREILEELEEDAKDVEERGRGFIEGLQDGE